MVISPNPVLPGFKYVDQIHRIDQTHIMGLANSDLI